MATTICNEIREHGQAVVFDDATVDPEWRTHPVPILYGFKSYASFPIFLPDGEFYGTLCAIDPARREITAPAVVATLRDYASRVRSEEHTSELQSLMRISYAVFCLKKKTNTNKANLKQKT